RELRRPERAGIRAVAAADAHVLVVQHHAFLGAVEAVDRAHRHAGRVAAMHAGDGDAALAGHPVVQRDDAPAVHAPRHVMLGLAGRDAAVAFDAALGVADELHSCHVGLLALKRSSRPGTEWSWSLASWSRCRSRRSWPC